VGGEFWRCTGRPRLGAGILCGSGVVAVAVERSSLDLGKNNSTNHETSENEQSGDSVRYDCREVYENFRFQNIDGDTAPYRCGSWDCYCCGYKMRNNLVEEIERVATERPQMSRLLTLTLDPKNAPRNQEDRHQYITERWNALRTRLKREVGDFSFIWVREEQKNGLPHLHLIVSRYLPQATVSKAWDELGGGSIVDIRKIDRVEKVANYVGKYLTKDATSDFPKGIRRYGSSADIELDVRGDKSDTDGPSEWQLVMDDYLIKRDGEPLTRSVVGADYIEQQRNGGPVGKGPPPD